MSPRREAKPITLTPSQRDRLEGIWFLYGNHGKKATPGNHSFIQGILEHGADFRPLFTKRTPKSQKPTDECVAAVEKILSDPDGREHTPLSLRTLNLVPSTTLSRPRPSPGEDVKSLLQEIIRRQTAETTNAGSEDETPDAA
ncbi:MAG: hypothetical protein ACJ74Q_15000 [Pyrinomonadaceae bacterium]